MSSDPSTPAPPAPSSRSLMKCPGCDKRGVSERLGREDHWACRYCDWFAYSGGADQVDVEGRIALRARNLAHPRAPRTRFQATFIPQGWVNDEAIDVDPPGEQRWVVSAEFVPAAATIVSGYPLKDLVGDGVLDNDDVLVADPAAPAWARDWSGPFSIVVTGTENLYPEDDY